jgi:pSer/pThr/pTyr-binding forkhead associated (FHA) protein
MAKLVVLSAALAGRTYELKVDKTTVGRLEDNTFQLSEPSVSSHHCEVLLRSNDVVIKDLNSTNGTFINGEKVSESVLKPGQTLRLGQVELRLDPGDGSAPAPVPSAASAPAPAPAPAAGKKAADQTLVMTRGINLNELDQGARGPGFDTKGTGFSKKDDKAGKIFWYVAGAVGLVIVVILAMVLMSINK